MLKTISCCTFARISNLTFSLPIKLHKIKLLFISFKFCFQFVCCFHASIFLQAVEQFSHAHVGYHSTNKLFQYTNNITFFFLFGNDVHDSLIITSIGVDIEIKGERQLLDVADSFAVSLDRSNGTTLLLFHHCI